MHGDKLSRTEDRRAHAGREGRKGRSRDAAIGRLAADAYKAAAGLLIFSFSYKLQCLKILEDAPEPSANTTF
jgi:hypothetical protein